MQIDLFHRNDLGHAAAIGAAFHAKHRTQRRLTNTDQGFFTDLVEGVTQTDRGGSFPLASRRRGNGGHQNQLSEWPVLE